MKSRSSIKVALLAATFAIPFVMATGDLSAQVIVAASNPDNGINNYGYPNVAIIDYSPFCVGCTNTELSAVVSDAGPVVGPTAMITVMDRVSTIPVGIPVPMGTATNISPDVAIGNDLSGPPGNYLAGVVFTAITPPGPGQDVYLTIFSITGAGTGALAVSALGTYNISGTGNVVGAAHIDAIAESSTPYSGLPVVDKIAITWKDASSGIMGTFESLNSPGAGTPTVINPNTSLSSPDVAAVERNGGGFEDWALFTYVDQTTSPNRLYYQEWRMSPTTVPAAATVYDNTSTYASLYSPGVSTVRIDAIDDYNQNTPGGGNATFDIVASVPLAHGGNAIVEYNDVTGAYTPVDITSAVAGLSSNNNILPQVACGPGAFYTVGYYSSPAPTEGCYATAIDWSTGAPTTDPNAYQIPTSWSAWSVPGWEHGVGLAATCNNGQNLEVSWEMAGVLYEKNSYPAAPYSFKHPNSTPAIVSATEWLVSPNPAVDHILLSAPGGMAPGNGTTYEIKDLSGKLILQGKIASATEQIDVNKLASGMYLVNVHSENTGTKTIKFVKQ